MPARQKLTVTAAEARAQALASMSEHKYHARRTTVDNITFASAREAKRYTELRLLERAGKIERLILQPKFPLIVNGVKVGTYIADFRYRDNETGLGVIEDVKGIRTPVYRLKAKLVKALFGIEIQEVE